MGIDIQRDILGLKGQRVNPIQRDEQEQQLVIHCSRDRRRNAIDPVTGRKGTVNRYVRRQIRDVPPHEYSAGLQTSRCTLGDGEEYRQTYMEETLPALDPTPLTGLKYLGVDEVARAKGHDYMTVIYDTVEGHLIGVETGRTADVFSGFLKQLPAQTTEKIEAVAMDMAPSCQKSVRDC